MGLAQGGGGGAKGRHEIFGGVIETPICNTE